MFHYSEYTANRPPTLVEYAMAKKELEATMDDLDREALASNYQGMDDLDREALDPKWFKE